MEEVKGKEGGGGRWEMRLEDGVLDLHAGQDKGGALEVKHLSTIPWHCMLAYTGEQTA